MWCYTLFPKILNMSLTAGIVIILVLLIRLPLKKAPKVFSYALWAVVLFRLLCPISFSSDFSLLGIFRSPTITNGSITYFPSDIVHTEYPQVELPLPGISQTINENLIQGEEQLVADPLEAPMAFATLLWLLGIGAMLTYSIVSVVILKKRLKSARNTDQNIYEADNLKTPFVLGFFRPRIYIPAGLTEDEKSYIIRHEQTHIRRFDHIIKPFAFLVLSIHWFNPLVWIAFVVMGTDMELSCDERVIKEMGSEIKKAYSSSLLSLATEKHILNGSSLAFGEGNVKGRIQNVLNYKKPAFWIIAAAVIACIIASVCLLSNPKSNDDTSYEHPYAEQLFEYRTSYVGDNSAVANIVYLLNFPVDVAYDHIELQTASEPYGIEVYFNVTPEVKAAYNTSEPDYIDSFRVNACIMLSLIGNADEIVFRFDDGTGNTVGRYFSREWAESIVGVDLWAESGSSDSLNSLIAQINEHVENAYASAEDLTDEIKHQGTQLEPTATEWTWDQDLGADMVSLDYASDDIVIFHGYFGLFVYDLNSRQLIRSLDLQPINCHWTQGDNYCEVSVSADGNTVQLHPISSENMYVYTVSDNTLIKTAYMERENRFSGMVFIENAIVSETVGAHSYRAVKFDTGEFGYLHTTDWTLGSLTYVRGDMVYKLFDMDG